MSSSKTTANSPSGEIAPKPSEESPFQTKYDAEAPPRCEMCDVELPDMAARRAHMKQTDHCNCSSCKAYVPPGELYMHLSQAHPNLMWNDHQVAWTDNMNVQNAMPWVREDLEKLRRGN
ncbi:hypothetical protein NA56DRAFT_685389 [Hyaloscypha hepaticicola]|uniref:C2H2-type domain-containing protein n=1 Tax=Hyaloscypha hepaticicola TaxID=2082293 RepID=A0A2J6QJ45_9HELO|nr:hypothetical protein NA56DRAFT_685389 [Hyaloscypha hepaticicola]